MARIINKTNNVLMDFLEEHKELFDKDMNATQLINASELRGAGYLGYMFKLIYACVHHMKLIVVIFRDIDSEDIWWFNISISTVTNIERFIYTKISSKEEPKCDTLDDLAYLIWKHICGGHFMLQESINEDQIKQFLKMTEVVL